MKKIHLRTDYLQFQDKLSNFPIQITDDIVSKRQQI